jgi:hypothetical protein
MKSQNSIFSFNNLLAAATATVLLLSSACSEDPTADNALAGPMLRFEVVDRHGWQTPSQSRSAGDATDSTTLLHPDIFILRGGGEFPAADTLFLHATVTDGIESDRSDAEVPQTRATPVEEDTFYESFGVLASAYTGSWSETSCLPDYMYNVEVTKASGWTTNYFWPTGGRKVRFFAYAPYGGSGIVLSAKTKAGMPTITYTVPAAVASQNDLLVAAPDETEGNVSAAVELPFKHVLTAVKFSCGDDMGIGTVKSIKLKGVYSEGTFNFGTSAWSGLQTPAEFGQNPDKTTDGTPDSAITEGEATFMMLPQTLSDGAQIEVVFNNGTTDHTLTADIGGVNWAQATTVTYRISTTSINWNYTLEVTPPADVSYLGGNTDYTVTSYRSNSSGVKEEVAWTARFSFDGGQTWTTTCPGWVSAFVASGAGSMMGEKYTATIAEQEAFKSSASSHDIVLQEASPKGTQDNPYDLSMFDIYGNPQSGMTTANCYVVRSPGWYRIPLVYGNAVKNGVTNEDAYNPNINFVYSTDTFVRHDDQPITAPCIADNGIMADAATMVWNDANADFVAVNPVLSTYTATIDGADKSLQYIVFEMPKGNIKQGNAVIAVRSGTTTLWSWHIWVTDEDLTPIGVTNYMDEVNYMMPVNLGWNSTGACTLTSYYKRNCMVEITQAASGHSRTFALTQTPYFYATTSTNGNSPYYQWGRKDPFLPSDGTTQNADKTCFGRKWSKVSTKPTPGMYIQNPTVLFPAISAIDTKLYNMWSAKNTRDNVSHEKADQLVIKTVYDPCPPGFHVPPSNAFTGFTTIGNGTNISSYWNVLSSTINKGLNFYSGKNKTGPKIWFPTAGTRDGATGALSFVMSKGIYWTALTHYSTGSSLNGGENLYIAKEPSPLVNPKNSTNLAYSCSVRPVQEQE